MTYTLANKSQEQLNTESEEAIKSLTGLAEVNPNGTLGGMIRANNRMLSQAYDSIDANFQAGYLRTASGPWLDALAADRGLEREYFFDTNIPCTTRTFELRSLNGQTLWELLGNPPGNFIVIPKGISISSSLLPGIIFTTNETITINQTVTSVFLGAVGQLEDQQIIPAGSMDTLDYGASPIFDSADQANLQFIQNKDVTGVERAESDESLRVRIARWSTAAATSNESSVFNVIESHPDVAQVLVDRNVRGTGSSDIIVFPRFNRISQQVIDSIEARVRDIISFGEDVRVIPPDYIPVSMVVSTPNSNNRSTVIDTLETFFEDLENKAISYEALRTHMLDNGISMQIRRLTVEGKNLLPETTVNILPNEMFVLEPRLSTEPTIEVILE